MTCRANEQRNRVLFIVLPYLVKKKDAKDSKMRSFAAFPYGVLSVASYLKKRLGSLSSITIIDCNTISENEYVQALEAAVRNCDPDIVAFGMQFDNSYAYLQSLSEVVRHIKKEAIIVVGGAAASYSYAEVITEQNVLDGLCYLEGELSFLQLIESKERRNYLENSPYWVTKKSLMAGTKPQQLFIENLDEVVDIDYSLVDIDTYSMQEAFSPYAEKESVSRKQFFLITSRGCPYKCVFCSNAAIHGRKVRYASVDAVIEHVRHLVTLYGMNVLTIYDEQLLGNMKRAKDLFRRLAEFNLRIECPNGLSVAFIDEEMAALMKKAGMDTVALAIESGSPYVLRHVIRKPLKLEMVKPVVNWLREYGIFIQGFFVIGLPGETAEYRRETHNFIKNIQLDWCSFSLATPLRGSELYKICIENGYIPKDLKIGEIEDKKYILNIPGVSVEEVTTDTYLMNLDVNFVNNYRMSIGDYRTAANSFRDVLGRYKNHAFAHYYLAKSLDALGEGPDERAHHAKQFQEIIDSDPIWLNYAKRFGLAREG